MEKLTGIPVSPGIAIGRVFVVDDPSFRIPRRSISEGAVAGERARLKDALEKSIADVESLRREAADEMGTDAAEIFAFHRGMLTDPTLTKPMFARVETDLVTAEYAVQEKFREVAEMFMRMNETVRTKVDDVWDIERRVISHLVGQHTSELEAVTDETVVLAADLTPSQAAGFRGTPVIAFATDLGGPTSHTAIFARALNIPAVVGAGRITELAEDGDTVIVDGSRGHIVVRPDGATIEAYRAKQEHALGWRKRLSEIRELESVTTDGARVKLMGNIEFADEVTTIREMGGDGVGLFRTEFLWLTSDHEPTEEEQYEQYRESVELAGGAPITIRTYDLGADKYTQERAMNPERNPFLGLRSIRYCLQNLGMFKRHLRAILRASAHGKVRLMFPLLTNLRELRQAKMILSDVMSEMRAEGVGYDEGIEVGMMVESPSAAVMAHFFSKEVDFFSIGTNDLVQYTLAVDRTNERVASLYDPAHPAVLKLIKDVIRAARRADIDVSLCGEIAGDPLYTMLLLGLGLRTLSATPGQIPTLKHVVRNVDMGHCERLARTACSFDSERQVASYLRKALKETVPEIISGRSADDASNGKRSRRPESRGPALHRTDAATHQGRAAHARRNVHEKPGHEGSHRGGACADAGGDRVPGSSVAGRSRRERSNRKTHMSKTQMIVNYDPGEECRVAVVEDGRLEELQTEPADQLSFVGNIYKGKVMNVEPSIQAAFIDFGFETNGFLHISDLHPRYFPGEDEETTERIGKKTPRKERPPIQACLKRGQQITVQVLKEGINTKGPTLTSYLSIPGRYLVMLPDMDKVGVSRKVEDEDARREMRKVLDTLELPEGFGYILRTAGMGRTKTDLKRDVAYLQRLWKDIENRQKRLRGPGVLYAESDLLMRSLRDVWTSDVSEIVIDNEGALQRASRFMKIVAPRSNTKLLHFNRGEPIFHAYDIEEQIARIHSREVPLPSGGSLVIDETEAMIAIDVNSGKMRSNKDAETTAYKTNCEAVDEICRQLRLRDIGGLVLCDLIDMIHRSNRRQIETRFRDRLKRDRAATRALPISQFGIVEMTRQRVRGSMQSTHYTSCPTCTGRGMVQKPGPVATWALRELSALLQHNKVGKIEMVVAPRVAGEFLSRRRRQLTHLESITGKDIAVRISDDIAADRVIFYAYDEKGSDINIEKLEHPKPPRNLKVWEYDPKRDEEFPMDALAGVPYEEIDEEEDGEAEASSGGSSESGDGAGTGKKRRRRRRGGRGRRRGDGAEGEGGSGRDASGESASEEPKADEARDEPKRESDEGGEERSGRRRRRRGGRRRRGSGDREGAPSGEASSDGTASPKGEVDHEADVEFEAKPLDDLMGREDSWDLTPEEIEEINKLRKTPIKASAAGKPTAAPEPEPEPESETEEEPEAVVEPEAETPEEDAVADEAPADEAPADQEVVSDEAPKPAAKKKTRKRPSRKKKATASKGEEGGDGDAASSEEPKPVTKKKTTRKKSTRKKSTAKATEKSSEEKGSSPKPTKKKKTARRTRKKASETSDGGGGSKTKAPSKDVPAHEIKPKAEVRPLYGSRRHGRMIDNALNLLLIVVGFGLVIVVHELGHFLAARWAGIRVHAFAVGFGQAVCSYRKGMGFRMGSTEPEYVRRLKKLGERPDRGDLPNVSATEYRLNWIPFGGYVKMLGQEDMDPAARSDAPDAYNNKSVGKRLVVISAGVVMNVLLAAVLFVIVFLAGMSTPPAIVGDVLPDGPAASAGVRPGDVIRTINGREVDQFAELAMIAAMTPRGSAVELTVERPGVAGELEISIEPARDRDSKLMQLGVYSAFSNEIWAEDSGGTVRAVLDSLGLGAVELGATLESVGGEAVEPVDVTGYAQVRTADALRTAIESSGGGGVSLRFENPDGRVVDATIEPEPSYQTASVPLGENTVYDIDHLLGLAPAMGVRSTAERGEAAGLRTGDVFVRVGNAVWPNLAEGIAQIRAHAGREIELTVMRDGAAVKLTAPVDSQGTVGFIPEERFGDNRVASLPEMGASGDALAASRLSPAPIPGSRLIGVEAAGGGEPAIETVELTLSPGEIASVQGLGWDASRHLAVFRTATYLRQAQNPAEAVVMGVAATRDMLVRTYITFLRLFDGTVRVEHLRGPVGIADVGVQFASQGIVYLLYFLALISANLAVINFLPVPFVDGGHAVFLVIEGIMRKPVPVVIQNYATLAGLFAIMAVFLIVTFNDITRLHPPRRTDAWAVSRGVASEPGELDHPLGCRPFSLSLELKGRVREYPAWEVEGEDPGGPVVIMTPGWGSSRIGMLIRMAPFGGVASKIIAWDPPGHGEAPGRWTMGVHEPAMLLAIADEMRAAYGKRCVLFGSSAGGGVSVVAAAMDAERPEDERSVCGVIAEAPYRFAPEPAEKDGREIARRAGGEIVVVEGGGHNDLWVNGVYRGVCEGAVEGFLLKMAR
ncbi:ptsI [Symbiodinium necroappetens]|uniref:Phosphoenolpyruvate-protein phosphotransferase n=1 Tax=Symbiodinium necroappetens TaxID=1628268 RepID=A0A812JJY2_9DINO|nr:ptsI [Symbiodinium necroappetens]